MERMGGYPRRKHAKSSSSAKVDNTPTSAANASNATEPTSVGAANTSNAAQKAEQCLVREQDQYMPIANVIRIMRRILPPHAKISDDAKETIHECVSKYISFITGEANERCQLEQRKTVTAEDVLWAMGKLGFDNYVEPLSLFIQKYRESEGSDRSTLRGEFMKREYGMDFGTSGPQFAMMPPTLQAYEPGFPFGPQHGLGMIDPSMVGLFRDGSNYGVGESGSSSTSGAQAQNSMESFDPFSQFK